MKAYFSLFIVLAAIGCADNEGNTSSERRFEDPNASINRTDIPRTLNANNATNSTPADWIDDNNIKQSVNTTDTANSERSRENPGAGNPSEAATTDNLSNKGNDNMRDKKTTSTSKTK